MVNLNTSRSDTSQYSTLLYNTETASKKLESYIKKGNSTTCQGIEKAEQEMEFYLTISIPTTDRIYLGCDAECMLRFRLSYSDHLFLTYPTCPDVNNNIDIIIKNWWFVETDDPKHKYMFCIDTGRYTTQPLNISIPCNTVCSNRYCTMFQCRYHKSYRGYSSDQIRNSLNTTQDRILSLVNKSVTELMGILGFSKDAPNPMMRKGLKIWLI